MKITFRGSAILAVGIALLFAAILFSDIFIWAVFIALVAIALAEASSLKIVTRHPESWFWVADAASAGKKEEAEKPKEISKFLYPGADSEDAFYLAKRGGAWSVLVSSELEFLKLDPQRIESRERVKKINAKFKTPFAGEYATKNLTLDVLGPLRLFRERCLIPLSFSYTVFPKVIEVAITSSKLLGRGGIGETPIERPGIGTEFYDMRSYQVGDDFKRINWKATARRGEIIVNEQAREVGASYYIAFETSADSFFDRDRLASTFLEIANSLVLLKARFGIIVHDGGKVVALKRIDLPESALRFALNYALEFAGVKKDFFSEELMAVPSFKLKATKEILARSGYTLLSEMEDFAQASLRSTVGKNDVFKSLLDFVRNESSEDERPAILYISGMFGELEPIVELGSQLQRGYKTEFVVVNPAAPWIVAQTEDEAYNLYQLHLKKLKVLQVLNIKYVVGDPVKVTHSLFSI